MSAARLAPLLALTLLAGTAPALSTSRPSAASTRDGRPAAPVPGNEQPPRPAPSAPTPPDADDPVLASLGTLLEDARKAQAAKDHALARARITQAIERALGELGAREDEPALDLLESMASFAHQARELRPAELARKRVLEVRSRTLPADHPNLQVARGNLAITIKALGDLAGARALEEEVLEIRSRTLPEDHHHVQAARLNLANTIKAFGDLAGARALEEQVLEVFSRTLPEDHPDLQAARGNLANTMEALGDLAGARALQEQVLAVCSRTLPEDHPELQAARLNLAGTIRVLGDLQGARALQEQVLEVFARTLPEQHLDLQMARGNLAVTMKELGDLAGARALEEQVLEVRSRTLPEDHPHLHAARGNLANTMHSLGDLAGARALEEQVLEIRSRTLPADHPDLQRARGNLAATIKRLGDLAGARALQEQVLEVRSRTLPEEHPDLQAARLGLAGTMYSLGDFAGARALEEQVLEVFSRTLPADHPDLQGARQHLAVTIKALGDPAGARALEEQVLEVCSRTLPADHPDLQLARGNLAVTLEALGDIAGARALEEQVLEVYSRTLPADHAHLQVARGNLAATMYSLGDFAGARALQEQVLEVCSRTLPEDHPHLQCARGNLAATMSALGDLAGARTLFEQVLEVFSRTLPEDHPHLQVARANLAGILARELARAGRASGGPAAGTGEGEKEEERVRGSERCAQLIEALCRSQSSASRAALLESSAREAEARCAKLSESLSTSISFAGGLGVLDPSPELARASFVLSETTRGAALSCAALVRRAAGAPRWKELREELRRRSDELASLVQKGATSESFHQAIARREELERELVSLACEASGGTAAGLDFDLAALGRSLGVRDAFVAYRRYTRESIASLGPRGEPASGAASSHGAASRNGVSSREASANDGRSSSADASNDGRLTETSVESLCAFVVRSPGDDSTGSSRSLLTLVELGPLEPIQAAVREWRQVIGAGLERGVAVDAGEADTERARGEALRGLVLDPLREALGDAQRVVVVLDDVLHLVPLEALPSAAASGGPATGRPLGDRLRIETRCTLTELLRPPSASPSPPVAGPPRETLVSLGGAAFNSEPLEPSAEELAAVEAGAAAPTLVASILRAGAWERGFNPLTYTGPEAREVAALHEEVFGAEGRSVVLEKRKASRASLEELAPKARWLHVATHGWFASESIRSWQDVEPLDRSSGLGQRLSGEEQVKGMSPMLLCGLALAGANLPENAVGCAPGLVTADELSTIDLSNCELAVLSACDTNVGERRAGQGVASLQKALQMAGARSVITSLWKVPDEATKELMLDFYRRLWVEKKPKHQALWEAKTKLRNEKNERGMPKYTTRDWAAWVLTGNPE